MAFTYTKKNSPLGLSAFRKRESLRWRADYIYSMPPIWEAVELFIENGDLRLAQELPALLPEELLKKVFMGWGTLRRDMLEK